MDNNEILVDRIYIIYIFINFNYTIYFILYFNII